MITEIKDGGFTIKNQGMELGIEITVTRWPGTGDNGDQNVVIRLRNSSQAGSYALADSEEGGEGLVLAWAGNIEAKDYIGVIFPALKELKRLLEQSE